jgi:cellulose synthase/poly-beta-1,6-N-acetylglucosamine synthase-like glycosyltransferase
VIAGGHDQAAISRPDDPPYFSAGPALSIVPSADSPAVGVNAAFHEIDCVRHRLPRGVVAAAERRAADLHTGADRVLLAMGMIKEEDYLRALASHCGVVFDSLADTVRAACPLTDAQLIQSIGAGLIPLRVGGDMVMVVAPREIAAQRLTALFASTPDARRRFRFTSKAQLHQFVIKHAGSALGRQAADGLRVASPALSAAPRARRPLTVALFGLAAFALSLAAPSDALAALNVALAFLFLAWIALRLFGSLIRHPGPGCVRRVKDHALPVYTVVAALYREAASVESLILGLRDLDYPREKLDIKLVVEPDDVETIAAIERLHLGAQFEIIKAPDVGPRTKPKALNAALPFVRGTFVVIYDAEDRPERDQLRRALDVFLAEGNIACVQARLAIDNTADSWLTRFFTAEYAGQFDMLLPGLAALRLPLPLGGSSNHFRTATLRRVGGWDPYNVTEDADLGMRLSRLGYRSAVIDSTTYEEAPARFRPWLLQRTRWFKGWTKTWLVHMRAPRRLLNDLGLAGFLTFQLVVGGNVLAALIYPMFMTSLLYQVAHAVPTQQGTAGTLLLLLHATTLVAGFLASAFLGWQGLKRRGLHAEAWVLLLIPIHWMLLSLAAWRALYQLLRDPYRWEKTEHGLAHHSRRREAAESVIRVLARDSQAISAPPLTPEIRNNAVDRRRLLPAGV